VKEVYKLSDLEKGSVKKTRPPIRLGVLGHPVAHSLSPQMQNAALEKSGLELRYGRKRRSDYCRVWIFWE